MQQEVAENRMERKERFATAQKLRFQKSMYMLHAHHVMAAKTNEEVDKSDKSMQDFALFLYRLESDFEDKRRRLEKMLFNLPVRISIGFFP